MPTANNPLPLAFATLMGGESTSYRIVAGANFASSNPVALQALSTFTATGGSVTLNGHTAYAETDGQTLFDPTMIRTGTGSIDVAAANDITLLDPTAPGVIYAAGAPAAGAPEGASSSIAAGEAR